ncbi:MAG: hypothetical protein ACLFUF_05595 [Opitutales bacterium]
MKSPAPFSRSAVLPRAVSGFQIAVVSLAMLPFLFHIIPISTDTPLGARLLPIFYAPLLAALYFRMGIAVALAALVPWISHILIGMPIPEMAALLTMELLLFVLFVLILVSRIERRWWMGPAAYLLTKPFSGFLFVLLVESQVSNPYLAHVTTAVTRSWPGLIALAVIGWIAARHNGNPQPVS